MVYRYTLRNRLWLQSSSFPFPGRPTRGSMEAILAPGDVRPGVETSQGQESHEMMHKATRDWITFDEEMEWSFFKRSNSFSSRQNVSGVACSLSNDFPTLFNAYNTFCIRMISICLSILHEFAQTSDCSYKKKGSILLSGGR